MEHRSLLIILVSCCAASSAIFSGPEEVREKGKRPRPPKGLKCWKCENEDLIGCKRNGEIEKCQLGVRQTCQTEIRYSDDTGKPLIKTGCKQGIACSSNKIQNRGAAWSPTQCNKMRKNSVCRCCCIGNMCNKGNKKLLCKFPSPVKIRRDVPIAPGVLVEERTCGEQPEAPENGTKQCFGDTGPRSFCRFKCNRGFKLEGSALSICGRAGPEYRWSHPTPTCLKEEICLKLPETPENGFKVCRGDGKIGSTCFFVCDHGYKMYGPSSITCELTESGANWTFEPPTCKIVVCDPLPPVPENGDYECDGIGEVGDRCDFTCDAGYDLIGHNYTVCEKGSFAAKGMWNNTTPTCKEVRCASLPRTPTNGIKECTADGELGTVCSFSCNEGYELKGFSETACHPDEEREGMGKWDREVPTCEPVCETLSEGPENGFAHCEGNYVGDECRYHCRPGFEIRGSKTTQCEMTRQGARWSDEVPVCEPVCKPLRGHPTYGEQTCLGAGNIGTSCRYACDDGFRLEGESESVCKATKYGADWTAPVPTCIPVCHPAPVVENGYAFCEGDGEVGSVCQFECNEGYRLNGVSQVTCESHSTRANWSDKPPLCEHYCEALPESIEHGNVRCNGSGGVGTACRVTCESEAYEVVGDHVISCELLDGQARWSQTIPRCSLRPTCPPIGDLEHGEIDCDSNLNVDGTICKFQCSNPGFSLVPHKWSEVVCYRNETWSKKPCCIDCTKVKRDIMIAMDSSGSINRDGWNDMVTFVQNIVRRFSYGSDATLFSIYQFSTGSRSDGLMYFGRYKQAPLIRQVGKMNKMGAGTMTGNGLQYAQTRFSDRGNREDVPDMLFILTDGAAEDPKEMFKAAKRLRKQGVEILALAIAPTDDFLEQMTKVTGDKNKVIIASSIEKLTEDVVEILFSKTCQDERECA